MERRRHRFGSLRGWAAGLGIVAASLLGGTLIARETVAGMDSFYRYATPPGWREPRARLEPTAPPPVVYSPIDWGDALPPPAPRQPDTAFDDPALLAWDRERAADPVFAAGEPVGGEESPYQPFGRDVGEPEVEPAPPPFQETLEELAPIPPTDTSSEDWDGVR